MFPRVEGEGEWDLPQIVEKLMLEPEGDFWLYDVKFYPFTPAGADPVFAVASIRHILIYRICQPDSTRIQLIQRIKDEDQDANHNSVVWTKDMQTGTPLLCFSGGNAKIKIIDAKTGELKATLIGHGGDINDLAVSPANPQILASGSGDNTIRVWSLNPSHAGKPCLVLCAPEGHVDTVVSIAFHATGRYIISGGHDYVINLWTLPDFEDDSYNYENTTVLYFPHFSTSDIHSNIVDCVSFHGDLILSKAADEHCIVLWSITNFDSSSPPPSPSSVPTNHQGTRGTRSSFSPPPNTPAAARQYTRLLQFRVPGCDEFYMRFGLSPHPRHPILAICNSKSRIFFWDLARLVAYHAHTHPGSAAETNMPPKWLTNAVERMEPSSSPSSEDVPMGLGNQDSLVGKGKGREKREVIEMLGAEAVADLRSMYGMGDPLEKLEAHRKVVVPKAKFDGRQAAWSTCGEWCVVVGSRNVIVVLRRGSEISDSTDVDMENV